MIRVVVAYSTQMRGGSSEEKALPLQRLPSQEKKIDSKSEAASVRLKGLSPPA